MKIYSWNVNGMRASYPKGLSQFIESDSPDILCLQETKAQEAQFPEGAHAKGYHLSVNSAQKPGYAGVAVFSKEKPLSVVTDLGHERFDSEGRMLLVEFKDFYLLNLYLPHGGRQKENLSYKLEVYDRLLTLLDGLKGKKVVVCGDFNIAHTELDLARPKGNKNNIMFTPEERAQIEAIITLGYNDALRMYHPEGELYTWWPYAFEARARNVGWRIDYVFVSTALISRTIDSFVRPDILGSDHGPIGIELN
jgi:exodeoxyribonuclease III